MILEITLFIALIVSISYTYTTQKKYAIEKQAYINSILETNKILSEEKKKTKEIRLSFGKMDKYTEDDLNVLRSNKDILNVIIKVLGNFTILRNDTLRNPENSERLKEVIGEANAFNEMIFFFYKLTLTDEELENMNNQ